METRTCQNCKTGFIIEPEDFTFYEKVSVPPPTWCPECRMIRRMTWRNERMFWKAKDSITQKETFSMFPSSAGLKIYGKEYWWSDKWDAAEFGRDYDFSVPFFVQLKALMRDVPWFNLSMENTISSDYSNNAINIKDCYLSFDVGNSERLSYCTGTNNSRDSFDLTACNACEHSAHDFYCTGCYQTFYSVNCQECQDVWFSKDLTGCANCFGCMNLRNKSYYIFNKPYAKEDYFKELEKLNTGSYRSVQEIRGKAHDLWMQFPVKYMRGRHNVRISGDYLYNSTELHESFWVKESEQSKYLQSCSFGPTKDSYDLTTCGLGAELCYEGLTVGVQTAKVKFSWLAYTQVYQSEYCMNCHHVSDCFGCVGLQNKQYCILNKQYSKGDYEALVAKIIRHMSDMPYLDKRGRKFAYGEFYPPELSPFAYNETLAQEYFPLKKEEVIDKGYVWRDAEERTYQITIQPEELFDRVKDVPDSILHEVIGCEHASSEALAKGDRGTCVHQCTSAFKIIPRELEFYRAHALPLPRLCPNCRHAERIVQRNPMKLWHRSCQCGGERSTNGVYKNQTEHFHQSIACPNEFETSYAPEKKEIVYCEQCYQQEVR